MRETHRAVEGARAHGDTSLDPKVLGDLREHYDKAVAHGIIHNRLRDWHDGSDPGYALGTWLREYKGHLIWHQGHPAHTCRCERIHSAHFYAEVSISIYNQQCSEKYVVGRWDPPSA